ncbi:hypothetical protein A2690_03510 [Candidatus Roizmanbacteria bacterium RIFCSPHIGHO2_01_FULL_39_12b]|uniref:RRM domain-containing protein n=1 Tax=Candidatus Roizmanbacteria bacterium RIFCSPHIGHO2_01_FULL_39_12b TaxID=1802030 RepID=A0A1F7GD56_9BACT|nr:MAG: hypothetical protein A2690_03510 [Candidatus Roizmanbacteria bacterium RIFCSPHIGHO2_01_FULL_39_12b]
MDANKLFIGNLSFNINSDGLKEIFDKYGEITDAVVISDRDTGRPKGFGFVTFAKVEDAQKALEVNGQEVDGRALVVSIARPREDKPRGNFGNKTRRRY